LNVEPYNDYALAGDSPNLWDAYIQSIDAYGDGFGIGTSFSWDGCLNYFKLKCASTDFDSVVQMNYATQFSQKYGGGVSASSWPKVNAAVSIKNAHVSTAPRF
jgi:hypothetical protein